MADCYARFPLPETSGLKSEQRRQNLDHLAKAHPGRQVRQADSALRLYGYYLSRSFRKSLHAEPAFRKRLQTLEGETRKALRLRHRSYSTEKTYV